MKVKSFLVGCLTLFLSNGLWAQDDPVVMTINGKPVLRSEFEYSLNKNNSLGNTDRKAIDEYVDLFVNYRLKVEAALDAHLDTLSSFRKEFRMYRDQQIRPLMIDSTVWESSIREEYNRYVSFIGEKGLVYPAHIFVRVGQKATTAERNAAKTRIDSIYNMLNLGVEFSFMAKDCSEDVATGRKGGDIGWIAPKQTLKEFEDVAYSLKKGEYSKPFLSTIGYHIVLVKDKKPAQSYEELRGDIVAYLERSGRREALINQVIDSMARTNGQVMTAEQVMDRETEKYSALDSNLKYLIKEYHDGLLLYEICQRNIWNKAESDTVGLEGFFKKNKKKYVYKEPHFAGAVYQCREEEQLKQVRKLLKITPEGQWVTAVRTTFNTDSLPQVRIEKKVFKKGENSRVDYLVFKSEKEPKQNKTYPYSDVYGRMLKKKPKYWTDVRSEVVADYQDYMEREFVKQLRDRYKVVVYDNVLKTVNKH